MNCTVNCPSGIIGRLENLTMGNDDVKGRHDPIQRFLKELAVFPTLIKVLFKFAGVVLVSMVFGFALEAGLGSTLYGNTVLEAFFPFMTAIAALLGFLVAIRWRDREAVWVWIPGVLWFAVGVYETGWRSGAAPSTQVSVAIANLFGSRDRCAESECLYELFHTAPLMCSIAYSLTAWLTLKFRTSNNSAD
jgi:hypothetical protein